MNSDSNQSTNGRCFMYEQFYRFSALAMLAAGCASAPPQSLVDARAAYQRASQGPAAKLTPAQLHAAATSLTVAEQTFDDEGDSANARDRAYVATRKAELAEAQASIATYDRTTALAARRVEDAKQREQIGLRRELSETRSALAGERTTLATQTEQLQNEKQMRAEAERRAAEAMSALASIATVKQEARGTVITLSGGVVFASARADLLPNARTKLDQVAVALLQGDKQSKIVVEGYTDSRGSAEMNQELSSRRAETVKNYLISKGLPSERISSQGFGPAKPVADNDTAEGRANNRRVEIVVQPQGK